MSSLTIGLIGACCIYCGALLGWLMQRLLPKHHLEKDSHEIVKLGAGMIATLTALVLGLLVSSAKATFDTMNTGVVQVSAKIILLDRVLAQYGPQAQAARAGLRQRVAAIIDRIWPEEENETSGLVALERGRGIELVQDQLRDLTPTTESQRELLAQARAIGSDIAQTRWLLIEEAQSTLPTAFLVVLITWLTILFASFGLFAPRNGTLLIVLLICAVSVSAAIFMVLEMDQPLNGVIKVSNAPLRKALEHLGR